LGELKIPGYSTYLHPYDETRLIGFGRDTEELTTYDSKGKVVGVSVVNRGLKLAMFDISDMSAPKELSSLTLGDEYADSELLYSPKALLFSKERGFMAFPYLQYGHTDYDGEEIKPFAGAYVFDISRDGISKRGAIETGTFDMGYYDYYNLSARRIIYIGNVFYTLSNSSVQSNGMYSLELISRLAF
jgi:uncharacterized secreted protein with C-terminal beta-propeller domain